MRDALSLTDQAIAYGNQAVNETDVRSMLGAIDQSYLFDILSALLNDDGNTLIEKAKEMEERSISFESALNDLAKLLHQIAIAQTVPESISNDLPERETLLQLAQSVPAESLQLYYQIALLGGRDINLAPDEYAGFTMTLMRMLAFAPKDQLSEQKKNSVNPVAPKKMPTAPESASTIAATVPSRVASYASQSAAEALKKSSQTKPATLISSKPPARQKPAGVPEEQVSTITIQTPVTEQGLNVEAKTFDGNWRNLVEKHLKLGLARALAQHCEMLSYDEHSITMRVVENQKHLASANYQDKLSAAINNYFGRKIQLNINIDSEANTPAKQNAKEKAVIQLSAEESIMNDEFVQSLVQDFDAKIIPNSIKPTT